VELLRLQLLSAIAKGERSLTLDVDPLPSLDQVALRTLISLLRIVRNAGGELALHVTRPELRATLNILALDKVFCTK
jgi:anti-anti-sigma regulatory factor